ncbi:MAG: T9SS type A sorting domain-containing protein, partial [Bacteroidetes bacterium]|nr:T9SS type A sorting domain-containing protein [Bacteroidota bacterium]
DGGETLSASSTITKTEIDAGKLKFKPAANATGNPYTTFTFKVNDGTDYSVSSYTMTINIGAVNDPPTAANNAVSAIEDNDKTFASTEFNYSDTEGSTLLLVQIATAPSAGTLYNDANLNSIVDGGEALSASSTVTKAAIDSGKLKFKPAANGNGSPYTTFSFKVNDGTDYSTSSYTMTINVTPVVDVTFTDGSVYAPQSASPSTNNNSVGRFLLTGDIAGASLSALTVSFVSSPSGVTAVKLWSSSDNAYDSGTDTQVSSTTVSGTTASFSSFSSSISASGTYYFVTVDLNSSASGTIEPFIANNSHVTISSGTLVGTITNASLSNGGAPLPVELTAFSASSKRLNVELQWKTATEVNNYGFEIQRRSHPERANEVPKGQVSASKDVPPSESRNERNPNSGTSTPSPNNGSVAQHDWQRVGFIEGAGTSNAPKEYIFKDKNSAAGKYLYRLKQIDRDGKFGYSKEVEIEAGITAKVFELSQNFPNPFNPTTAIEFSVPEDGMTTLKVFDILGREVRTLINEELKAGVIQHVEFDASHLSSGVYFARLQVSVSGGKELVQMKRMILVK